jgi:beta-xylosidase
VDVDKMVPFTCRSLGRFVLFFALFIPSVASLPKDSTLNPRATSFNNPVLWEDYPDLDVFRVGSVFYYSSSTFAYSPGAPLLKSYDLVNWTPATHSVPKLNFGDKYDLTGGTPARYVKGIWASTARYRASNDKFYWYGCVDGQTYIWTSSGTNASANNGEVAPSAWNWQPHPPIPTCYYDSGVLIDDDDTMYVTYGNPTIHVAQLSPDGLTQVSTRLVYTHPGGTTIEGARMYKAKGAYYILVTRPADAEFVLKSTSGPFGPYTSRPLVDRIAGPLEHAGFAHQGGMVDTTNGDWYYVAFLDAYPGGRIPVVAPLRWTSDGWPEVVTDAQGRWGTSYPVPVQTDKTVEGSDGLDEFRGGKLSQFWEWNHNPDESKFSLGGGEGGLVLRTASVTGDLFSARNTLTRRIAGPKSRGTFRLDVSKMRDGDRAGAVLFRDRGAYIGVWKQGNEARIVMVDGLLLAEGTWTTASTGKTAATGPVVSKTDDVWFRIEADITPAFGTNTERTTTFSYSVDGGKTFLRLGPAFAMSNSWRYFTGYRFGVFNFGTKSLGGEVKVKSFKMDMM